MSLKKYSDKDLEAELERRKADRKAIPTQLKEIDTTHMRSFANDVVTNLVNGNYDEDSEHWAFEIVMTSVYGPKFFDWYNKVIQ